MPTGGLFLLSRSLAIAYICRKAPRKNDSGYPFQIPWWISTTDPLRNSPFLSLQKEKMKPFHGMRPPIMLPLSSCCSSGRVIRNAVFNTHLFFFLQQGDLPFTAPSITNFSQKSIFLTKIPFSLNLINLVGNADGYLNLVFTRFDLRSRTAGRSRESHFFSEKDRRESAFAEVNDSDQLYS